MEPAPAVITNENELELEQRLHVLVDPFTSATSLPFTIQNRCRCCCCCTIGSLTFEEPKPSELADISQEEWQEFSTKLNEVAKTSPLLPNDYAFTRMMLSTIALSRLWHRFASSP